MRSKVIAALLVVVLVAQPVAPVIGSAAAATNTAPDASIDGPTDGGLHVSYTWTADATDAETDAANLTYRWDLNGDGTAEAAGQSVSKTFSEPGEYTISLTVEDPGGLTDTATITFTVAEAGTDSKFEKAVEENPFSVAIWAHPVGAAAKTGEELIDEIITVDERISSLEATAAKTREAMMYQNALDEEEDREAFMQIYDNYARDSKALASQDARYAIAQAYSDGKDLAAAENASVKAIRERFARMQRVVIERYEARGAQLSYHGDIMWADDEISNSMLYAGASGEFAIPGGATVPWSTGTQKTKLVTGETVTYQTPIFTHRGSMYEDGDAEYWNATLPVFPYPYTANSEVVTATESLNPGYIIDIGPYEVEFRNDDITDGYTTVTKDFSIRPYNTTKFPDREILAAGDWWQQFKYLENASEELVNQYRNGTAETIYLALEDGEVAPNDIYSSETMLRKMSGDTDPENMSKYNLRMATLASLGLNNPNATHTNKMVIDFKGVLLPKSKNATQTHVASINTTTTDVLLSSGYNVTAKNELTTWGVFAHYEDGRKVRIPRDYWTIESFSEYLIEPWNGRPDGNLTNVSVEILDGGHLSDNLSTPYIEDTVTGMLFSENMPADGQFSVNETYHTGNIEGMETLVTLNGSVLDIRGQFTVEAMYAPDGTEVRNVSWENYDPEVHNSTEFVNETRYIQKIVNETIQREEELADSGGGGGGGSTDVSLSWPSLPSLPSIGGIPGSVALLALLVIVLVLIAAL